MKSTDTARRPPSRVPILTPPNPTPHPPPVVRFVPGEIVKLWSIRKFAPNCFDFSTAKSRRPQSHQITVCAKRNKPRKPCISRAFFVSNSVQR